MAYPQNPFRLVAIFLFVVLSFACVTSWAQDERYHPDVDLSDCLFNDDISQDDDQKETLRKQACYQPAIAYAQARLDRAINELAASGVARSAIDNIQKKWKAFVAQDCIFQTALPPPNSFGQALLVSEACYLKHMSDRANELMWINLMQVPVRKSK